MSATSRISLLVCGVKSVNSVPTEQGKHMFSLIQADQKRLVEEGFEPTLHLVDPAAEVASEVTQFKSVLESRRWDGVSIGFGVRGDASLTPMFEGIMNAVLAKAQQPPPKLIFTENYDKLYVSIRRAFPAS